MYFYLHFVFQMYFSAFTAAPRPTAATNMSITSKAKKEKGRKYMRLTKGIIYYITFIYL